MVLHNYSGETVFVEGEKVCVKNTYDDYEVLTVAGTLSSDIYIMKENRDIYHSSELYRLQKQPEFNIGDVVIVEDAQTLKDMEMHCAELDVVEAMIPLGGMITTIENCVYNEKLGAFFYHLEDDFEKWQFHETLLKPCGQDYCSDDSILKEACVGYNSITPELDVHEIIKCIDKIAEVIAALNKAGAEIMIEDDMITFTTEDYTYIKNIK